MKLMKLFKKPTQQPLPVYPALRVEDLDGASALIFYGSPGNRATELVGARLYGHRYNPPAFHAALYLGENEFLNVGKTRTVNQLDKEFTDTRRVDVIVYALPKKARNLVIDAGYKDTSKTNSTLEKLLKRTLPDYAVTDFLRFGLKWLKPSKKDFCSENVVENIDLGGLHVSDTEAYNTAPWDLVEWAEEHPEVAKIYTLHEGATFKQKLGR